ncbi:DNA polymerase III subunit beta [Campylobacter geochelonis]|uniref:Beta sliding clamp n=1 Tax=Campylobacter geochelonis TaxID=1780362 RepID=A0A128EBX3_9BACT|nr:DNA polymerase III subunit beta [Campylobacter geochelonis]QKF70347.1 DNA polymerase III, beta subunit [Campylobacter geochelonis]CZE46163.1 DNA polymerase III subunit beta [Campylobacter geochelonis]CZE46465.1 DNA polymerase III subunit beta [Campylobacter geochelonis]CZE50768.1 DNA polymerase III subunit beta [Campylobacter geochelonis]
MKFIINKSMLDSIITNTNAYIDKKDVSSITSHIFINAENGILSIKATDHEIGLTYNIKNVNVQVEGKATANGKKILDIIKGLKDEDVTIETMNNFLFIRQKNSKYKLPMYNSLDFPEFPTLENKNKFDINSAIFGRSLKKIFPMIDTSNPNYALNGALIDIKDNYINLVGTDGKRLGLYKLDAKTQNSNFSLIIPKKAINEMQKLFFDKVEIYYDENILIAVCDNFEFFTKLINKKFPDYQRVIPSEFKKSVVLQRDKVLEGIKTINMVCDKMKITVKPNSVVFESINEDNSEAKTEIEVVNEIDDDIVLRVTNRYLLDFLNSIEDTTFRLDYNDVELAFMLSSNELLNIIMPTNI